MRIISGKCRGLVLDTLKGENTRPTLDRVKESLFNILGNIFFDMHVLDLFAGSGALGLESLSRGAKSCIFVDNSKEAIDVIKKNILKTHMESNSKVYKGDYNNALSELPDKSFDLIFLDPPYGNDIGISVIKRLDKVLKDDGIIVLETDNNDIVPDNIGAFEKYDVRKYGRVVISFFRKAGL